MSETFVLAIKREARSEAPDDWKKQVEDLEDVEIVGSRTSRAIRVRGPDGLGNTLSDKFGNYCHIEPVIMHQKLASEDDSSGKQEPGGDEGEK